jgi:DNA end-binding protein Ku
MPPRALLTGTLTLGLVTVPIRLYTATRSEGVAFHLLHEACGNRIQNRIYCPVCAVAVPREELVRGFEVNPEEYVRFTDAEIKALEDQGSGVIDILEFVPLDQVDPVYFERTYYLGPGKGGDQAYQVLRQAMADRGRVALATYAMRGKSHLVLLRPVGDGLHLHTLYYADEVASFAEVERPDASVRPGELELAVRLIEDLAQPEADLAQHADEYRQRVLAAVEHKRAGGTLDAHQAAAPLPTDDLMATLQRSLEARRPRAKPGPAATEPESAAATPSNRRRAS